MAQPGCEDFANVVGRYVDGMARIKDLKSKMQPLQAQMKAARADQADLEEMIIKYMDDRSLDVCRITRDGESGQLTMTERKAKKALNTNACVQTIATFFEENRLEFPDGNASTNADKLVQHLDSAREVEKKRKLTLR